MTEAKEEMKGHYRHLRFIRENYKHLENTWNKRVPRKCLAKFDQRKKRKSK